MRMAAQSGDIGERGQHEPDRCDGPDRNRQSAGGEERVSIDRRGEDQLEVRAPKERPGEIRDRLANDPWEDERDAAGENRRDARRAIGAVFNADKPAGDRVGCDVKPHEHERRSRIASLRSDNAPNIDASARALRRKSCRTKRGKAAKDQSTANHAARPASEVKSRNTVSSVARPRRCWRAARRASLRRSSCRAR